VNRIDINCDLGEGCSRADCLRDARLMPFISRCNIACGGHAGNATTMALSLENARTHQIIAGAHPGYPDRSNFGRTSLVISHDELVASLHRQVSELHSIAAEQEVRLEHLKLHGALYNDVEASDELAEIITRFIHEEFPHLKILGLANAAMERAAIKFGQPFLREGFMDRRYLSHYRLAPRTMQGSVIEQFGDCLEQVLALARGTPFVSVRGEPLKFSVDSICLHGDTPGAEKIARELHRQLQQSGLVVAPGKPPAGKSS